MGWVLPLAVLVAVAGCDRRVEPFVPGEQAAAPDLSRIFPEGAALGMGGDDPGRPEGGRGAPPMPAEAGVPVRGTIRLAPDLAGGVPPGAVLFLVARRGEGGPPLAVKRIADPGFPLDFELGPDDRMIATLPFVGPMRLSARVDADGNASTRTPGDLAGTAPDTVQPGAEDVTILIDEVL